MAAAGYHTQTSGKLELFHKILKDGIWNCPGLDNIEYRNAGRLHFLPDVDSYEPPSTAFDNKWASEKTGMRNPDRRKSIPDDQNQARHGLRIPQGRR